MKAGEVLGWNQMRRRERVETALIALLFCEAVVGLVMALFLVVPA